MLTRALKGAGGFDKKRDSQMKVHNYKPILTEFQNLKTRKASCAMSCQNDPRL